MQIVIFSSVLNWTSFWDFYLFFFFLFIDIMYKGLQGNVFFGAF